MGLLLVFGVIITLLVLIAPDGIAISQQPRLPTAEILANWPEDLTPPERLPILPDATGYRYDLINVQIAERPFNLGFNVTQRSLRLAIKISTLLFTLIYATTLFFADDCARRNHRRDCRLNAAFETIRTAGD